MHFLKIGFWIFCVLLNIRCRTLHQNESVPLRIIDQSEESDTCNCNAMQLTADEVISIKNMAYFEVGTGNDSDEECIMVAQTVLARMCYGNMFQYFFFPGQTNASTFQTPEVNAPKFMPNGRLSVYAILSNSQFHPQRTYKIEHDDGISRYLSQPSNRIMSALTIIRDFSGNFFGKIDMSRYNSCSEAIDRYLRKTTNASHRIKTEGAIYYANSPRQLSLIGVYNMANDWDFTFQQDGTGNIFGNFLPIPNQCNLIAGGSMHSVGSATPAQSQDVYNPGPYLREVSNACLPINAENSGWCAKGTSSQYTLIKDKPAGTLLPATNLCGNNGNFYFCAEGCKVSEAGMPDVCY